MCLVQEDLDTLRYYPTMESRCQGFLKGWQWHGSKGAGVPGAGSSPQGRKLARINRKYELQRNFRHSSKLKFRWEH